VSRDDAHLVTHEPPRWSASARPAGVVGPAQCWRLALRLPANTSARCVRPTSAISLLRTSTRASGASGEVEGFRPRFVGQSPGSRQAARFGDLLRAGKARFVGAPLAFLSRRRGRQLALSCEMRPVTSPRPPPRARVIGTLGEGGPECLPCDRGLCRARPFGRAARVLGPLRGLATARRDCRRLFARRLLCGTYWPASRSRPPFPREGASLRLGGACRLLQPRFDARARLASLRPSPACGALAPPGIDRCRLRWSPMRHRIGPGEPRLDRVEPWAGTLERGRGQIRERIGRSLLVTVRAPVSRQRSLTGAGWLASGSAAAKTSPLARLREKPRLRRGRGVFRRDGTPMRATRWLTSSNAPGSRAPYAASVEALLGKARAFLLPFATASL